MSDQRDGGIAWTDQTWNPVRGCSRVSSGCTRCYAETMAARFIGPGQPYEGLARRTDDGEPRWTGSVRMVPEHLGDPVRWRRPRRIFVNSMSDLFHERLNFEDIASVFGVMAAAPQHIFQVLTKRPERMLEWFKGADDAQLLLDRMAFRARHLDWDVVLGAVPPLAAWPLPNVHLGVSVEDQRTADERIPLLLQCPAAVRWISAEPLLEAVDLAPALGGHGYTNTSSLKLDSVVIGGESGKDARPFDIDWARRIILQCRESGTKVFMKQLGSEPRWDGCATARYPGPPVKAVDVGGAWKPLTKDRKGGDPMEWPEDLRVRELP